MTTRFNRRNNASISVKITCNQNLSPLLALILVCFDCLCMILGTYVCTLEKDWLFNVYEHNNVIACIFNQYKPKISLHVTFLKKTNIFLSFLYNKVYGKSKSPMSRGTSHRSIGSELSFSNIATLKSASNSVQSGVSARSNFEINAKYVDYLDRVHNFFYFFSQICIS